MAVEAVVSGVAKKLGDLLIDEATLLYGVKDKVQWIQAELRQMQCFLQDADDKQQTNLNVKNWVNDIRDVAFDAEDVLETYIIDKKLQKQKTFIMRWVYILINLCTQHQIGTEIERIKIRIRQISDRRSTYGIEAIGGGEGSSSASERLRGFRQIYPHHEDEIEVVGLEKYVNALKAQLIGESHSPRRGRCVISIVGMGGSGKTTLAKTVYNCDEVAGHFPCRAWVSVSQVYDIMDILQNIAEKFLGLKREESQKKKEEELREMIYKFLKAQRHLVVLDDVWEVELWNRLKPAFSATNNESRIIFTTRNKEVADPKSLFHELQPLSNEKSWELFVKKVLSVEEVNTLPKELEEVGKPIVKKCGGLPLAIVLLGGLLSRSGKISVHHWSNVLARLNLQLNANDTPCTPILALSYNDLPFHLKSCFLYLGIFPEDYEISARMLIQMWISEGFVQQQDNAIAEDIAEDYLEKLVDRSMVQVVARRANGSINKCRIHDILRDLAISKAKEVELFHIHALANSSSTTCSPPSNKVRRLALHSTINEHSILQGSSNKVRRLALHSMEHSQQYIRSAFCFLLSGATLDGVLHSIVSFEMLRVLHISCSGLYLSGFTLPKAIGKLINLRYLRLENFSVRIVPSIIGNLENLQTLYLKWIPTTRGDHYVISKLNHLRHLKLDMCNEIRLDPPSGNDSSSISTKNLQTLWALYVDRQSLVKDGWDKYTNLRKLYLSGDLESHVEALVDWIAKLDRLESLRLDFRGQKFKNPIQRLNIFSRNNNFRNLYKLWLQCVWIEVLPNPTEFPSNLSQLSLNLCRLGKETFPTLEKLSNLKFLLITISTLHVNDINFLSGGFPQLQQLHLRGLDGLEEWKVEKGALPCLRELSIFDCKMLKALPDGLRHVTTLQKLYLKMDREFLARVKPNEGEDWAKVAHVPTIQKLYLDKDLEFWGKVAHVPTIQKLYVEMDLESWHGSSQTRECPPFRHFIVP